MLKAKALFEQFLDRIGLIALEQPPLLAPPPPWEELELLQHGAFDQLELCLLWKGKVYGHAWTCRSSSGLHLLSPPIGPSWACRLLEEAMEEWLCET